MESHYSWINGSHNYIVGPLILNDQKLKISDLIKDGHWFSDGLSFDLPPKIKN